MIHFIFPKINVKVLYINGYYVDVSRHFISFFVYCIYCDGILTLETLSLLQKPRPLSNSVSSNPWNKYVMVVSKDSSKRL